MPDSILNMFTAILWLSPYGGAICLCCPHCGSAQAICLKSCFQQSLSQLKPLPTYAGTGFKKIYTYSRGEIYTMHIYCGLSVVQHKYVWSYSSDRFCLAYVLGSTHWLNCGFALMIKNTMYNKVLYVIGTVTTCMISVISVENVWEFQVKCVRTLIMQCCLDYLFQWIFCKKTKLKTFGAEVVTAAWSKSAGCCRQSKSGGAKKKIGSSSSSSSSFLSLSLAARDWKKLQTSCEQF